MKTIKEVAEEFAMTPRTIRYYEELGMLKPERTTANRRLYSKRELAKLKLIVRGKQYGFSLEEIKEMVLLFDVDRTGKKQLKRTIEYGKKQIQAVEMKIEELQLMKSEMEELLSEFTEKLNNSEGDK